MDAYFAGLCAENITLYTDEVAKVQQLLEHGVVHRHVLGIGTKSIAGYIHLNTTLAVHQLHETCLAHNAAAHHTASHAHHAAVLGCGRCGNFLALLVGHCGQVNKLCLDICRESIGGILCCGIWVDAQVAHLLKITTTHYLLFAQFLYTHITKLLNFTRKDTKKVPMPPYESLNNITFVLTLYINTCKL